MADSKKINPIEKAGISGVASGATIEGLSALMGADSIEKKYFTRYGFSEGGKEWGEISFEWMPTVNEWMPYNEDDPLSKDDLELFRKEKEYELVNEMLNDEKSRLHTFYINNPYHVDEEEFNTKYEVLNEDGEIENLGLLISWDEPEIEYRKSQYSTDPETPLHRFEFLDAEEQSAYWFLKGEMQSRAPLNEMDLEQIMEMLQNVPAKEMNEAIEQAEMMGDEAAMIVLVMADNKRKFREEYASEEYVLLGTMQSTPADGYNGYMNMMSSARRMVEIGNETGLDQKLGEAYQDESGRWFLPILERKASEEESTEVFKLKSYFSYLKSQNPDLAKEIEFSVKNEDELPSQKIYDAGFNPSIIEEWVDYIGVEDDNLQPYESCSTCEGEGWIMTSYTPATRYEPADGDGEDCGECGGTGMIDPADYMDKEGQYYAESFEAEYDEEDMVKTSFKCYNIEYKYRNQSIEERHPDDVWPSMTVSVEHKENIEKYTLESLKDVIRSKLENKISFSQGEPVDVLFFSSERLAELQKKRLVKEFNNRGRINHQERWWAAESFEAESCPNCKTNSDYICDSCIQCKGCCETSYGCYEIALCNDCDGSFIGKDIEGCCGSCDDCCECDQDPSMNAESFEATEWVGFCPECNKWRTKDMSVKIDSKINTTGWSIPDKLLGKRLCKKSQRFGNIRQSGDTFTGYGSRGFDDSYCGTPLTKVKSKYKGESFEAEEYCHVCGTHEDYESMQYCALCKKMFCRKRCWGSCKCGSCDAYICEECDEEGCPPKPKPKPKREICGGCRKYYVDWKYGCKSCFPHRQDEVPSWAKKNAEIEYDEEDMVSCRHCWNEIGNEKEVYGDETVEYEMANGELVCVPCYKAWMEEYKNDLDPHYSPFYAETESILKSPYLLGAGIFALTLGILSRKR